MPGRKVPAGEYFYRLLHPKVATLIATVSPEGKPNVATFAWVMPVSTEPPYIAVAVAEDRLTYENMKATKEFTVNVPDDSLLKAVWVCGTKSGREVEDKASLAGVTLEPSEVVKAPSVKEAIATLECRVVEDLAFGDHHLVVAEVVASRVREDLVKYNAWDVPKARVLLHVGGRKFAVPGRALWAPR